MHLVERWWSMPVTKPQPRIRHAVAETTYVIHVVLKERSKRYQLVYAWGQIYEQDNSHHSKKQKKGQTQFKMIT